MRLPLTGQECTGVGYSLHTQCTKYKKGDCHPEKLQVLSVWVTGALRLSLFFCVLFQGTNQHDVQELNRILFSALEHSLVDTTGSTLIHRLYHGTIVNNIVCKECGNVSQRQVCECLQGFPASLTLHHSTCSSYADLCLAQ